MSTTGTPAVPDHEVGDPRATRASPMVSGTDDVSDMGDRADGAGPGGRHLGAEPAVRRCPSPVGELVLIAGSSGLAAVLWPDDERPIRVGSGLDARSLVAEHMADRLVAGNATGVGDAAGAGDAGSVGDTSAVRALLDETARQLDEYFAGSRFAFDLPLDPVGTEFQVSVWRSLADIGYGETSTYGEQAARIGRPTAVRAVGAANGRNPLSIVLPCHRVVGGDGRLTGFAGGLEAKKYLLEHEARHRRR